MFAPGLSSTQLNEMVTTELAEQRHGRKPLNEAQTAGLHTLTKKLVGKKGLVAFELDGSAWDSTQAQEWLALDAMTQAIVLEQALER